MQFLLFVAYSHTHTLRPLSFASNQPVSFAPTYYHLTHSNVRHLHVTMRQTRAAAKHLNQNDKVAYLSRVMRVLWRKSGWKTRGAVGEGGDGTGKAANKYENIFSHCGLPF